MDVWILQVKLVDKKLSSFPVGLDCQSALTHISSYLFCSFLLLPKAKRVTFLLLMHHRTEALMWQSMNFIQIFCFSVLLAACF